MYIGTKNVVENIENIAVKEYGLAENILMENAGKSVFSDMENYFGTVAKKSISVVVGGGKNGGDAMVTARYLLNAGAIVKVFVVGQKEKFSPNTLVNYDILKRMGADIYFIATERDWDKVRLGFRFAEFIVDGLCGTGLHLPLRPEYLKMIELINAAEARIIAIDLPSGVEADTGKIEKIAVRADLTVSFILPKKGTLIYPGLEFVGKLLVHDLGIPQQILATAKIPYHLLERNMAEKLVPKRLPIVHKGNCGRILAIAGSKNYIGAPVLAINAALRYGVGMAILAIPESLYSIFAPKLTEAIMLPLKEKTDGCLTEDIVDYVTLREESYDSILIGPGLGRQAETGELVRKFIAKTRKPLVIDADAIYALADKPELLKECAHIPIITPHLGEMANLLGIKVKDLREDIWHYAQETAEKYRTVVVLKSEKTVVATPDGEFYLSTVGNPGMATAGTGDVLAGIIAGARSQLNDAVQAALLGVYMHGRAGDIAAKQGMQSLLASDIISELHSVYQEMKS